MSLWRKRPKRDRLTEAAVRERLEHRHWADPWEDGWHESMLICRASCCAYTPLSYAIRSHNEARKAAGL